QCLAGLRQRRVQRALDGLHFVSSLAPTSCFSRSMLMPLTLTSGRAEQTAKSTRNEPRWPTVLSGILAMILIGGTAGRLLVGAVLAWFDQAFWLSFLYSLAATMGGVIGGIPAAFAINRWQERRAGRAAEAEREAGAARTNAVVVRVLLGEFRSNEDTLAGW